jgi:Protein of unknown function (DUF1257)
MSHFTRVRTQLRDLETVRQALTKLGYSVHSGEVRGYASARTTADLVVEVGNGYDVGFRYDGKAVTMVGDFWGLKVKPEEFIGKVTQQYAYLTVMSQAANQGWQVVGEEQQSDGSIKLVVERWR